MLRIDIHSHIMPDRFPDFAAKFGYGGFVRLDHHKAGCARMMIDDRFFREVQENCWDPAVRCRESDAARVDVQVLSTIPVLFSYWTPPHDGLAVSQFLNDHLASVVARWPDRFIALGTLPMQAPELAARELERCVRELGMPGVEIGSHINDWNLSDPALDPFYEAAESLGAAVFVHPWDMMGKDRMPQYWLPWLVGMPAETSLAICSMIFGGVFDRFPKLRVAFAHGGGAFPHTIGRVEHGWKVRPDLCAVSGCRNPREYLGHFWVDSLVHDADAFRYLASTIGEHRIALGTDYPFPLGEWLDGQWLPGSLIDSMPEWNEVQRNGFFHGNALDWLGRSAEPYLTSHNQRIHARI
jgi:aminocarboxymuconate-semialdehyde decarboxylase